MSLRLPSALLCLLAVAGMAVPAFSAAQAPALLVADLTGADTAQRILAVSLQGLANGGADAPRVFLLTNPSDADWLHYCLRLEPRDVRPVTVPALLEALRPELTGQVLYDPEQSWSLNIATTAAGVHRAVISATDLGLPTILDLRGRWQSAAEAYRWAAQSLLPECSRSQAALLPPDAIAVRDYVIQQRLFTLTPPTSSEDATFDDIVFSLTPGAAIYGTAPPPLRRSLSRASHYLVPVSQAANLSFLSRLDKGTAFYQYIGYLEPAAPRYLTMILDCSDLDLAINDMPALWSDPARGTLTLGWAIPAALAEAAPPVLRRYYADAYRSGTDQFVLGPSGAGEIDLALAKSPYAFFEATARAQSQLDISTCCHRAPADPRQTGPAIARLAAQTRTRGVFLLDSPDMPPSLYEGVPTIVAPRVDSVAAAIAYLNNIPLDRRCVALLLDPRSLGPAEAAHIAAHVSDRYVVLPPEEMMELMDVLSRGSQPGPSAARFAAVTYPDSPQPDAPLPVRATTDAPENILSASVVYHRSGNPLLFWEPMSATAEGYTAEIPPLFCGGAMEFRVRARDRAGRVAWLSHWTYDIPRADADSDGLSDAEERLLLTDPHSPDTDSDGLRDNADPSPIRFDHAAITYLGPIRPPSDLTYLHDPGDSRVTSQGRRLQPGQHCIYWLPLALLPAGAPAVIALDGRGPASLAAGADTSFPDPQFKGELSDVWYSDRLPPEAEERGAFLHITCPEDAQEPLLIRGLAVLSPPASPSIVRPSQRPAYPGPEQPITVSALVFSPTELASVSLTYRIDDGGTITMPMRRVGETQYYRARIPALDNRDRLEWWITARDSLGGETSTAPSFLMIGGRARAVVSLLARRDFYGDWRSAPDWNGAARLAPSPGLRDTAPVHLTGGTYTVWVLAGGRGRSLSIHVRNTKIGSLDPLRPDGWQRIGRVELDAGRHKVHIISEPGADAPPGAAPRYASVIFTADSSFAPPANRILDLYNTIALLAPRAEETLRGRVELLATSAGNVYRADFSLDGQFLHRASGPPFRFTLNSARFSNGPHTLRVDAVDRAGPTGLAMEIPIIIAN